MVFLTSLFLQLCLLATQAADERDACLKNTSSSECTSLIQSRYNLTSEEIESLRSRIELLVKSDRLHITGQGPYSPLEMAMHCYAVGNIEQGLPSDTHYCVSCNNCRQHSSCVISFARCPKWPLRFPLTHHRLRH